MESALEREGQRVVRRERVREARGAQADLGAGRGSLFERIGGVQWHLVSCDARHLDDGSMMMAERIML